MIDLVEGDRLPLGRDATGEPLPHGDADASFHLLLDALGGSGHELVPGLVQQEDGGRVGAEDLAEPFEQLVQEVVDGEVGKGGVADALDTLETFQWVERGSSAVAHLPTVRPNPSNQQCSRAPRRTAVAHCSAWTTATSSPRRRKLDDLLSKEPKPKPDWPS